MIVASFWQSGRRLAGGAIIQQSPKGAVNQTSLCWIGVCAPSWVNLEFIAQVTRSGAKRERCVARRFVGWHWRQTTAQGWSMWPLTSSADGRGVRVRVKSGWVTQALENKDKNTKTSSKARQRTTQTHARTPTYAHSQSLGHELCELITTIRRSLGSDERLMDFLMAESQSGTAAVGLLDRF